ncbi:hypothetical protein JVT61DRAFT_1626 [Boletus reticuloceps]|uniref:Uncharacterized protein n=1 Tax=Boletus reticuloceps TaxID=495285 RepID=A0A8I3ABH6_9AGAM|nr:hypothetical protein JVT61DRAFT_1626 [Boletus reticuloceps]
MPVDRLQNPRDKPLELRASKKVDKRRGMSEETRKAEKAASTARPPPPHLPEPVNVSLKGEQEN